MSKTLATASIDLTIVIARTISFTCATESRPLSSVFSMIRVIRLSFGDMCTSNSSYGTERKMMLVTDVMGLKGERSWKLAICCANLCTIDERIILMHKKNPNNNLAS